MKKLRFKKLAIFSSLALIASTITAVAAACSDNKNETKLNKSSLYVEGTDYNFGIAIDALNTLNYLKFASLRTIAPSLVEGFLKEGPSTNSPIGTKLGLSKIYLQKYEFSNAKTFNDIDTKALHDANPSRSFYDISSYGYLPATLNSYVSDANSPLIGFENSNGKIVAMKFNLNNGASKWSDGKEVVAQDFIDAIEYILDLNTGSQLRSPLLESNIKGSNAMNEAQENYIRVHGKPYENPFGRLPYVFDKELNDWVEDRSYKPFQSQTFDANNQPVDTNEVNAIKRAALAMGYRTGEMYTNISNEDLKEALQDEKNADFDLEAEEAKIYILNKSTNEYSEKTIFKNRYFHPKQLLSVQLSNGSKVDEFKLSDLKDETELLGIKSLPRSKYDLFIEYEDFAPKNNLIAVLNDIVNKQQWLPANRKFIETHGGISKFGSNLENFVSAGPFKIKNAELGPNGFIELARNDNYYSNEWTMSDKIKVFFNSNNEVKSLWYEEGIISSTRIPSSYQLRFWSKPELRKLMTKSQGHGTVAVQFNLDAQSRFSSLEEYEKNKDKLNIPILDPDLRRAISYATNREAILRLTGWTASFPVSTWTAFQVIKDSKGKNLELWFDEEKVVTEYKDAEGKPKSFPLQNNSYREHAGKSYTFENINRNDRSFDLDVAKFYIDRYKKNNPSQTKVKLNFVYPSEPKENVKAAIAFKDLIDRAFGGFVEIDLKALPPNTYSSFIAAGDFDISYQNFDKFASQNYYSSMLPFFVADEIDLATRKNEGFQLNPTGNWTFADFFKKYKTKEELNAALERLGISQEDADIIYELATPSKIKSGEFYNPENVDVKTEGKKLKEYDKAIPIFKFNVSQYDVDEYNKLVDELKTTTDENKKNELTQQIQSMGKQRVYLNESIVKQAVAENKDLYIKVLSDLRNETSKEIKLTNLNKKATFEEIVKDYGEKDAKDIWDLDQNRIVFEFNTFENNLKADSYSVKVLLKENQKPADAQENWKPDFETLTSEYVGDTNEVQTIIFKTAMEEKEDQRQRIRRFFASNRAGWEEETEIFRIIAALEKILREDVPILPIMDIDTNWNIASLGGKPGTYVYSLQFAYDYKRPPRPGLPTTPEQDE